MDEDYAFFLKKFGSAIEHQVVPNSSIERYKNKLPEQLLKYWEDFGWCGYAEGLFWTVNPQDYESLLNTWLAGTEAFKSDNYHVIARSAFGELYLWGEKSADSLSITSYLSRYSTNNSVFAGKNLDFGVKVFFSSMQLEHNDLDSLFKPALKSLGPLKADEMYGFVPALALGGPVALKNLQKVKTIEHLAFLSQISPLQDWGFPDV
ncbi:GAD-like domain-containing protein [Pseudomonas syringae]|uniref:GAD-like domain protein n=4 Tax=Pseudomonas syringae TaxID=317 RepID=A0A656JQ23_PSESF|nr:GAD-like domain-containing protein [Pseudomonas syringae]EPN44410.1 hypothetical protein A245_33118 [Pseudomonas syringae pv. actinidiae ICMP 19096]EPM49791.1 hypothetical protein A246_06963 [Pseudomonas syringae pv. actinidiae ICMP 19098]EPN13468.1 hypothetical protein A249_10447 [Pseudomonas syringae pv. actinidiae ICMP 18804]EPN20265.1 hypothetical protein A248_07097 [Pseudomonas syringae pv. actinidiae ICMP 19100]EPN28012.1 hypothetical protein A247_07128 [Pseudomonas syringae pv. actin